MRRIVLVALLGSLVGCGGRQVPTHNGYKSEKSKPWKSAKKLAWDESMEGKVEGDLSYPDHRRAKWYTIEIPAAGELTLKMEVTPPGDAVNEDFDLAMEILDPGHRVISKADAEEEDVGELAKTRTLYDLQPGRYLLHLYLQGRMDEADYLVRATFKRAGAGEAKSDFPAQVAFLPPLPMVPLNDDTPKSYKAPVAQVVTIKKTGKRAPAPPPPPAATTKTARIVNLSVSGSNTIITIGFGSDQGASTSWKAKVAGVQGLYNLSSCSPRTCTAAIAATPDQIKAGGGTVTLTP